MLEEKPEKVLERGEVQNKENDLDASVNVHIVNDVDFADGVTMNTTHVEVGDVVGIQKTIEVQNEEDDDIEIVKVVQGTKPRRRSRRLIEKAIAESILATKQNPKRKREPSTEKKTIYLQKKKKQAGIDSHTKSNNGIDSSTDKNSKKEKKLIEIDSPVNVVESSKAAEQRVIKRKQETKKKPVCIPMTKSTGIDSSRSKTIRTIPEG